jgi:hypothetical protein
VAAAQRQVNQPNRYEANVVLGGIGLQIVDNRTNTFFLYGVNTEKNTYVLSRTINLNQTGRPEIKYVEPSSDKASDE